jgi:hypothetical protein
MAGRLVLTNTASAPLRARYDATNYADFTVSSTGDLTITPTGGDTSITGTLAVSSTLAITGVTSLAAALNFTGTAAIQESGTERGRISGGVLAWGTTVVGTAAAGGIVTKNGVGLYGVNGAGASTHNLIRILSTNDVLIGYGLSSGARLDDNYLQFSEITDPAASGANTGRVYMRDNGAGKTQLVVRFPTGAVQVIATEP